MNTRNKIKKLSKHHPLSFFIVIFVLFVSLIAGYFTCKHLTQNDKFEILGEKNITLTVGSEYEDQGAIAILFGKDISSQIKTETNIKFDKVGDYYIKYYIDNFLYKDVYRYRYIKIVEVSE